MSRTLSNIFLSGLMALGLAPGVAGVYGMVRWDGAVRVAEFNSEYNGMPIVIKRDAEGSRTFHAYVTRPNGSVNIIDAARELTTDNGHKVYFDLLV